MKDGVLSSPSRYCITNESECVIFSDNERKNVKVFISWTQRFCFSSLLRQSVKFVKWRLPCISHFVCCSRATAVPNAFRPPLRFIPRSNRLDCIWNHLAICVHLTYWSLLNNSGLYGRGLSVCWNPDCRCRRLLPKSRSLPFSGFLPLDVLSLAVGDILRSGRCRWVRCRGSDHKKQRYRNRPIRIQLSECWPIT